MIIDSHQHFWLYDPARDAWITPEMKAIQGDFLPKDLEGILASNQVDGCVAVQADQSDAETAFLLQLADANEFVKGVVGWIDLCAPDLYDRLEKYSLFEKLKGFRHVAQGQPEGFLLRQDFMKGVGQLSAFDFTYDILVYANQLSEAYQFARQLPHVRFVLDHIAKPRIADGTLEPWTKDVKKLAELPNVSCKISGMVTEGKWHDWRQSDFVPYLDVVTEAFGTDRLMYGSDWPVCLVAASYESMKGIVDDYIAKFSALEKERIMGKNAMAFYGLEP
jgi:L-fuconolactonase